MHVTEPMKRYAEEKIAKLERLGERIIDVNVTMDVQKLDHRCDIRPSDHAPPWHLAAAQRSDGVP